MKKKIVSAILTAAMMGTLLVGCGSEGNEADGAENSSAANVQENAGSTDSENTSGENTSGENASGEKTKIRVYIGGDNADLNAGLVESFNAQSSDAEAEIVTLTEGQSGYQMLTVMYNSNSAPNVFFLEAGDIANLQDKLADVSDMECISYAADGTMDDVTYDGKILGVPVKEQAYGLIYN